MIAFLDRLFKRPFLAILITSIACFLMFSPKPEDLFELPELLNFVNDKIVHCIMFLGMSFLWKRYFFKLNLLPFYLLLFAICTEIIQYLLPKSFKRGFEISDILADTTGILLGLLISWLFDRFLKR